MSEEGGSEVGGGGGEGGEGKESKPDDGFNSFRPTSHGCRHADELYALSMTGVQQLGN